MQLCKVSELIVDLHSAYPNMAGITDATILIFLKKIYCQCLDLFNCVNTVWTEFCAGLVVVFVFLMTVETSFFLPCTTF